MLAKGKHKPYRFTKGSEYWESPCSDMYIGTRGLVTARVHTHILRPGQQVARLRDQIWWRFRTCGSEGVR